MRENFDSLFLSLCEKHLGFKVKAAQHLKLKLLRTLEREPDFLMRVKSETGSEFILHLEFQLKDDHRMLDRMRTYHALLSELHRVPVKQFVIYLGRPLPQMRTTLTEDETMTGFHLLDIHRLNIHAFLTSQTPEEIIMAVLADFGNEKPKAVLQLIVRRLIEVGIYGLEFEKMIQQLGILSRIPNLVSKLEEVKKEMPTGINIREDELYLRGKEQQARESAARMLKAGAMSREQIATYLNLPLSDVEYLAEDLGD
ncbi:MAG: hypothetical protein AAGN35_01835 [Bacteroidota bacterium]